LNRKITINQIPLTNKENQFLTMSETLIEEGASLSTFGENYDLEGRPINPKINYLLFGTTIDYFVNNKILGLPNYIKIDVDGIEHLILKKGTTVLKSKEIKSILVEVNENFIEQSVAIKKIMMDYNFYLEKKSKSKNVANIKNLANTFNYIFIKK